MEILNNCEYDKLVSAIMVYPCALQLSAATTSSQQVDLLKVSKQYNCLLNTLIENSVNPYFFDLNGSKSQVFARDIGFIINDILFISNMTAIDRKKEVEGLINFAKNNKLKNHIMENKVEGGDILVHNDKVFIGQGDRTNINAVEEIKQVLLFYNKNYELIPVSFNKSKIHLDCVFNILNKDTCLITKDILSLDNITKNFSNCIELPMEVQYSLGTNVVSLSHDTFLSSSELCCKILKEKGFNPIYIDFSEIIKASGSLGCCLMPLIRNPNY